MTKRSSDDLGSTPKRRKTDFADDVEILVGSEAKRIRVHKNILCATSIFFQTALNSSWIESKTKTITLKKVSLDPFLVYINWLYTKRFDVDHDDKSCSQPFHPACHAVTDLLKAYTVGDFLHDVTYCNAVVDELLQKCRKHYMWPSIQVISHYWPNPNIACIGNSDAKWLSTSSVCSS